MIWQFLYPGQILSAPGGGTQGLGAPSGLSSLYSRYATECGLVIAIFAVIVIAILLDPTDAYLAKPLYNAKEILRHASILGIFAMGAGIVIISGGIDLSSGSMIAFRGFRSTTLQSPSLAVGSG